MTQPAGLGIWIWKIKDCEGGNWDKIIQRCHDSNIKWIAVKCGENVRNGQWTPNVSKSIIEKCHTNNLQVLGWNYSYPATWQLQVNLIKDCLADGLDGWIIDAEIEWQTEPNSNDKAEVFMQALRTAVGNEVFIAHAPFPIIEYHSSFPYVGFGKYVDAVMPQSYWVEFNWSLDKTISMTNKSWSTFNTAHPNAAKPVYPIGVTYGSNCFKYTKGILKPEDIQSFLQSYKDLPVSLYSYDAACQLTWDKLKVMNGGNDTPIVVNPLNVLPDPLPVPVPLDPPTPQPIVSVTTTSKFLSFVKWVGNIIQRYNIVGWLFSLVNSATKPNDKNNNPRQ